MSILHPISSMTVARLAAKQIDGVTWSHVNRVEAREIIARMENTAASGPAVGGPGARVLDANARRLSALATTAHDERELYKDGQDLSWLFDPALMDEMALASFEY